MRRRASGATTVLLIALSATVVLGLSQGHGPPAGSPSRADAAPFPPHVPGEVIVGFRDPAHGKALGKNGVPGKSGPLAEIDATGIETLGSSGALLVRLDGMTVEEAIARLAHRPDIAFVEPNYLYSTQAIPDDPQFDLLWGLHNTGQTGGTPGADIRATEVWESFRGTRSTLVAVIDTGVDYNHPDLAANIWTNPGEVPGNGIDDDGNGFIDDVRGWDFANDDNDPMDDHFHGTHVAGTIGAVGDNGVGVAGVNWEVSILPLKFLDEEGFGTTSAAIGAVDYAINSGARILNNSWGGSGFSQALRLAIERADREDVLFVAAAGNNLSGGRDNDVFPFFPATYPTSNIISVAATDHDDVLGSFSNFGDETVDLSAPGVDVYSTFPGNDYGFLNGTSMATPHVSGTLALLLGRYPEIAAVDAKALVLAAVDLVPELAGIVGSGGRLNASRILSDPDDTAPAATLDLRVDNPDANRVDLAWTATGDDGFDGEASRYDVRFAPFPIDAGNFVDATVVVAPPRPAPPGATERLRVTGLDSDTTYWFAVQVLDEFGNRSPLSNVVQTRTLGPPAIRVAPDAIEVDLFTGESVERLLHLENLGIGELIYDIVVEGISPTAIAGVGTGRPSTAPGATGTAAVTAPPPTGVYDVSFNSEFPHSGPSLATSDNKEVTNATAANGSTYSYHEFNAPGGHFKGIYRQLDAAQPVYVSFWVRPGSVQDNDAYVVIRDSSGSDAIFFYATSSGHFRVNADVGGNSTVPYEELTWYHIEFREIDFAATSFDYYVDGILIQPDVRFRFPSVQDFDRLDLYSFDGGAEAWWDEIVLTAHPPVLPVEVVPASGVLPAAGSTDLNVRLNATGLNGGVYDASLVVANNDPLRPELRVAVQLRVTGAPDILLSDSVLDFGALFVGDRTELQLAVQNRGTDLLEVVELAVSHPDFSIDQSAFALAPGESRELTLAFLPTVEGAAVAQLTIDSNDPDDPMLEVTLAGQGLLPPDIAVTPAALSESLITGGSTSLDLTIRNTGFSDLSWEIAYPGPRHPTLESTLDALDAGQASITSGIPGLHPLKNGRLGASIPNGGESMFANGNFLSTDRGVFLSYSDGVIAGHELLGETGRYFTRKYPGLFVLAADLVDTTFFNVSGRVGAGAPGVADEAILELEANALGYRVFVMRSSGTARPSVNHMVIVEDRPGIDHGVQRFENQYSHVVFGIDGETRLYYLLFGGSDGRYYDDATLEAIAGRFFDALNFGPEWLRAVPRSGRTAASGTSTLRVDLDAFGLEGSDYESALRIFTNVPVLPEIVVPVTLRVEAAADIAISPMTIDFGSAFVGHQADGTVEVWNMGTLDLNVSSITSDNPAFSAGVESLAVAPGEVANLALTFAPTEAGGFEGRLTLATDDPDEATVTVTLLGNAQDPPILDVEPAHLDVVAASGTTATTTLLLRNLGATDLVFELDTEFAGVQSATDTPPHPGTPHDLPDIMSDFETASGRHVMPVAPRDPAPTAKAGEIGQSFFFHDGFEDGLLDGWLGLGPGTSSDADEVDITAERRTGRTGRGTGTAPWNPSGAGPVDVALSDTDTSPPAVAKGALQRLGATPSEGVIAAGAELPLAVTVDADQLMQGDYAGVIHLSSNDPARPEVAISVSVHVIGEPLMIVSPLELAFGNLPIGVSEERFFTVSNTGFATLNVDPVVNGSPDFTTSSPSFTVDPGRSRTVRVTFAPNGPGLRTGTLSLINNSPESDFPVPLSGIGVQGGEIVITPETVDQVQFRGETFARTLTIRNRGGESLDYSIALRPHTAPLTLVTLFEDDMESERPGWTTEVYNGDNLWSRNDLRFNSASHAWTCTATDTGTYATDSPISAAAVSPPIDLRHVVTPIGLRFHESFTTEPRWDQCMVDASIDDGDTWVPLRGVYGSAPSGSSRGWVQENLSLAPFAGEIVRLRYYFETVDTLNNAFPGWSFDDIHVRTDDIPWIATGPSQGTLAAGEEIELTVTFTALESRPTAIYTADIEITTSAALTPRVVVPARLDVRAPPRAALVGAIVHLESDQPFAGARAGTRHRLDMPVPPAGTGTVALNVLGNFGAPGETASLTAEALALGTLRNSDEGECNDVTAIYPLSSAQLADLAADGLFEAHVRNSADVDATCGDNRHRVTLEYVGELQRLEFGDVRVGDRVARPVSITNTGGSDLLVTGLATVSPGITVEAPPELVIPPLGTIEVTVLWSPADGAPLEGALVVATNDRQRPEIHLPLGGTALTEFPEAIVDLTPLSAALPPGSEMIRTHTVQLHNAGNADLIWSAQPNEFGPVEPAAGVLAPGASIDVAIHLTAATLEAGDYTTALVIDTNDSTLPRIEIPLILHVRLVDLELFTIDFTPKYATHAGTVEVVLQLPVGLEAADVLKDTVTLLGIGPDSTPVLLLDTNRDGIDELVLQFDLEAFQAALPIGDTVPVETTGEIDRQAWFGARTWIRGRIEIDPENLP